VDEPHSRVNCVESSGGQLLDESLERSQDLVRHFIVRVAATPAVAILSEEKVCRLEATVLGIVEDLVEPVSHLLGLEMVFREIEGVLSKREEVSKEEE
jgi:uncharacterized protein (DUF1778 family)